MSDVLVCGLDEVGRGSLAGPLLAGAALFKFDQILTIEHSPFPNIMDSKKYTTRAKRELAWKGLLWSPFLLDFSIGEASVEEIDRYGIDWANDMAFQRALADLKVRPTHLYVDGDNAVKNWPINMQKVEPKADVKYWPVSAASVIAKVIRDRLMEELDRQFPMYGWDTNSGYGSEKHKDAIMRCGPSPHHRKKFIRKLVRS